MFFTLKEVIWIIDINIDIENRDQLIRKWGLTIFYWGIDTSKYCYVRQAFLTLLGTSGAGKASRTLSFFLSFEFFP